ncbi:MAG: hybrid sensor histidine kinase/response regulator [Gammaproteobacteria bacterium]|nr:hybrid sensor histidine kinase/response regulator [Gammaproteobacteria bacterium]
MTVVNNRKEQVLQEQIDILFGNVNYSLLGTIIVSTFLAIMMWGYVDHAELIIWISLVFIIAFLRSLLGAYYKRNKKRNLIKFKNLYLLGTFLSGATWGYIGLFDIPLEYYYFIIVILCGMTVNAVVSYSSYLPVSYAFFMPAILPLTFITMQKGDEVWGYISIMSLAYLFTLMGYARIVHRSSLRSIMLRFENLDLIEEVTKSKEDAELANMAKSRFLAIASHDLRQPLHSLGLFIDALKYCNSENERKEIYSKLERSQESLTTLFDALLDISKLDADTIDICKQPVSINNLFNKIIREYELEANEKGINISYRPCASCVYTDPLLFERIIQNLLSNAVRYTENGGILLACRMRGDNILIQVWDTGCGIERVNQAVIFEEFKQLHNPERNRSNGIGLGLAIVKRLCILLGHTITLHSIKDKGSVFSVSVPISHIPIQESKVSPLLVTNEALQNKHILIVDDEIEVREAMTLMLEKWGCKVTQAESFDTVIELLDLGLSRPDVVVSDYRLGEYNTGINVIELLQKHYSSNIPSLLVTGDTAASELEVIQNSSCSVLHKPVKPAQLRIMLNSFYKKKMMI